MPGGALDVITIMHVATGVIPAALGLLPPGMDSPQARAMLLSIGLQESLFRYRVQLGGPARGFWQFEQGGGVRGVLSHPASKVHVATALETLRYRADAPACYAALADNDVLACVFARLLLWTSPRPLPARANARSGWLMYLDTWRPGRPHPDTWEGHWTNAWEAVEASR